MFNKSIKKLFTMIFITSDFKENEEQNKHITNVILNVLIISATIFSFAFFILSLTTDSINPKGVYISLGALVFITFLKIAFKLKKITPVIYLLNLFFIVFTGLSIAIVFGIYDPAILMIPIFLLVSSLISSTIIYWSSTSLYTLIIWITWFNIKHGTLIPMVSPKLKIGDYFFLTIFVLIGATFIRIITSNMLSSLKREKLLRKKYIEINDAVDESILICDKNGIILNANLSFKKMFGYDYTTNTNPFIQDFSSNNSKRDETIEFITRTKDAIKSGFSIFEWKCQSLEDRDFWAEVTLKYTEIDGDYRVMVVIRDIHEQKKNREFIIQNEKIISLGGVAAGIAHEINNPLAGIAQNTTVLNRRLFGDIKANKEAALKVGITIQQLHAYFYEREIDGFIEKIMISAGNASKIVKNMLHFARKENDEFNKKKISDIIEDTLLLANSDFDVASKYTLKNIKLSKTIMKNEPEILCQPSKLQQVFFNIIKNSIEAMSDYHDQVDPQISIKLYQKENYLYIELKDNGPGIPQKIRKKIFEPFYTTKPVDKGTGLGMSVAHFIITNTHKGTINIESETSKFTKFIITLPIT